VDERDVWLERIASIRRWSRDGERAPHKPLLILYALGQLQRTGTSATEYANAERDLAQLLRDFGPTNPTTPAYPFHHLQTDGLWIVDADGADPGSSPGRLRSTGATGRFTPEFEGALRNDPGLVALIAHSLLDSNFPESLHHDLCDDTGLDLEALETAAARLRLSKERRQRDPRFRHLVLVAYEYRCAMCGYDGRLGTEAVGLDAAHLRWWAFDGPDTVDNALCLCSFHHKLLDRGVLGITTNHEVAVSNQFVGRGRAAEELVLRLVGQQLLAPQAGQPLPADNHVGWHIDQVFKAPARIPA
jgi:putative restriction endonuclease